MSSTAGEGWYESGSAFGGVAVVVAIRLWFAYNIELQSLSSFVWVRY